MSIGGMIWKQGEYWFGVLVSDEGVIWLNWSSNREEIEEKVREYPVVQVGAAVRRNLERARREINEYFEGGRQKFTIPVVPEGTEFEKQVWQALLKIPFGKCMSYGELAKQIGKPGAARAVGRAAGKNPVPLIIPCHRLIAANGGIGGFAGGLDEKRKLLKHEGVQLEE